MSKLQLICRSVKPKAFPAAAAGVLILAAVIFPGSAPLMASGYEFDGVGARSIARGGAVIADAADWSAIYWNPANLTDVKQREAGLELKAGKTFTRDGNSFSLKDPAAPNDVFNKKKGESSFFFGSMGTAIPLDDKSAIGAGFYLPLLQGAVFKDANPANAFYHTIDYDGSASIMVGNVSYARLVSDKASVALGLNAIRGGLNSELKSDTLYGALDIKSDASGYGVEGVFGGKYKYSDNLSFGAVFRTGSKVKLEGDATATLAGTVEKSDMSFTIKQPPTSGIGAAWRLRPGLMLTVDFTQTWWNGFSNASTYDNPGTLLTSKSNTFDWKTSFKYRAGALWNYSSATDLMAGYAYDTPAIDGGSIDFSSAIDVPMHRFSAAASHRWGSIEGTLAGLVGYNSRNTGGVNYRLGGWYFISEVKYTF